MHKKRCKRVIVLSDIEDSDDDEFDLSHPRKRPNLRSSGQDTTIGFYSGPSASIPDLILPTSVQDPDSNISSDEVIIIDDDDDYNRAASSTYNNVILPSSVDPEINTSSDDIIFIEDDDDSNRAKTSTFNNVSLPSSDDPETNTCSDVIIIVDDDDDSKTGRISPYNNLLPNSEENSATEERTSACDYPGCFLEEIISPNSIYVTQFQVTKEQLVEKLYHLYNKTVFEDKLPQKLDIIWTEKLTSESGLCRQMLRNRQHRFSVIELATKVVDSAERLRSTLVHEMCHAACWIIDGEVQDNHGPLWQSYAKRVTNIHPELPEVTTCHNYAIKYSYYFHCWTCDDRFGGFQELPKICRRCGGYLNQVSAR